MKDKGKLFNSTFIYFLIVCLFIVIRILSAYGLFSFLGNYGGFVLSGIIQLGLMLSLPIFLYSAFRKKKLKATFSSFGFKKINFNAIVISILIGLLIFILNIGVSSFFSFFLKVFGYNPTTSGSVMSEYPIWLLFVNIIFTAILPGICEEVAHRGMLLNGFKGLGVKKAILYSSLLFGLMHLNIEQFFYAAIIGAFMALLRIITGSIYPSMIVHFMNNFLSVFMTFAYVNNLPFGNFSGFLNNLIGGSNFLISILIIFVILMVTLMLLLLLTNSLFKETTLKRMKLQNREFAKGTVREAYLKDIKKTSEQLKGVPEVKEEQSDNTKDSNKMFQTFYNNSFDQGFTKLPTEKMGKYTKLIFVSCFVVGGVITLFTFIWGVL